MMTINTIAGNSMREINIILVMLSTVEVLILYRLIMELLSAKMEDSLIFQRIF